MPCASHETADAAAEVEDHDRVNVEGCRELTM
jgi:hypothetical protein